MAMDIQDKIINAFKEAGQAMRPGELAEKAGLDKKEVEKAIKKMKDAGTLHSPKRCFYDINR
jgi:DNA-binding Lrp family transcriptional regulator